MICLEEEPYRLAKRGDTQSLDLLGFLQFLKHRETDAYTPVWLVYARIRRLVKERRLPTYTSREEWLSWKAESFPSPSHYARAVGHYLAYRGLDLDRRLYRQVWFEQLMAGESPPQVAAVPERLRSLLRDYLVNLRTKQDGNDSTLDLHGRNLIAFFEWLGQNRFDLPCSVQG